MTLDEFKKLVAANKILHPSWRYGQSVFNLMYEIRPELADKYRGTDLDPYYRDDRAEAFMVACFTEAGYCNEPSAKGRCGCEKGRCS